MGALKQLLPKSSGQTHLSLAGRGLAGSSTLRDLAQAKRYPEEFQTVTFHPGKIGIDFEPSTGAVGKVRDGQAKNAGVAIDWQIVEINGLAYTEELLEEKVAGSAPYDVTFLKSISK